MSSDTVLSLTSLFY